MKKAVPIIIVVVAVAATYLLWPSSDSREAQNDEVIEKLEEISLEIKDEKTAERIIEAAKTDSSETRSLDSTDLVRFREVQQKSIERLANSDKKNETPESILEKYEGLMANAKSACDTIPLQAFIKDYMSDEYVVNMKQANPEFKAALRKLSKERRQIFNDCRE